MAWISQYNTNAAGKLKNFLDDIITNYGLQNGYGWSIKDNNAGTNIGVYQCQPDANSKFILVVKDDQSDYATIEYWEDWDSVNHVGVGNSMTYGSDSSKTLRIRKATGIFNASIKPYPGRIVLSIMAIGSAYYLGYPRRFDETKNTPVFIGHNSYTSGIGYNDNPLADQISASNTHYPEWRFFKDSVGNLNKICASFGSPPSDSSARSRKDTLTTNGQHYIIETPVQEDASPFKMIGILDGVMCKSNCPSGLANGDTIIVGNDVWLAVIGQNNSTCLIKEE